MGGFKQTGLNQTQRAIIEGMIINEASGEEIRREMDNMAHQHLHTEGNWDYKKNQDLCRNLAANGYAKTAEHLENLNNGEIVP